MMTSACVLFYSLHNGKLKVRQRFLFPMSTTAEHCTTCSKWESLLCVELRVYMSLSVRRSLLFLCLVCVVVLSVSCHFTCMHTTALYCTSCVLCMHVRVCVCMCVCMYACLPLCCTSATHVHTHVHTQHIRIRICIHVHIHRHTNTTQTHTNTQTHIHIHM